MTEEYAWIDELEEADDTIKALLKQQAAEKMAEAKKAEQAKDVSTTTQGTTDFKPVAKILHLPTEHTEKRPDPTPEELATIAEGILNNPTRLTVYRNIRGNELEQCRNCVNPTTCPKVIHRWETPKCTDFGGSWEYVPCRYMGLQKKNELLRSSQIPRRYVGKTLEDYKVDSSNQKAVEYAKQALNSKEGAYFFGECGTGKTFLAALIAQDFLQDGKSVIFIKVPSLLDDIKATFNGRGSGDEVMDKVASAKLVVLDDFGMEKSTQWAGSALCRILDMRYDNPDAVTIVTSNLSIDELAVHLNQASDGQNLNGSRIADRLREICKPILLKGTTRRN